MPLPVEMRAHLHVEQPSLPATAEVTDPQLAMVRFHGRDPEAWVKKTVQERFRYRHKPEELQEFDRRSGLAVDAASPGSPLVSGACL